MALKKSITEQIARLQRMSWDEVRTRSGQEFGKRMDRVVYALGLDPALGELRPRTAKASQAGGALVREGRFFFEPSEIHGVLGQIKKDIPGQAEKIVERAERICQHRFDLLGYEDLKYGPKIDWHLDPVHDRRAPLKPSYKIHTLDFSEVGDHKIIWELSRHQHLVTLAKAWNLTGEERFGGELFSQWYDWQKANPYPRGINWASSLEVAFRSLSWLWVRALVKGQARVPAPFPKNVLKALALSGRHIARYLSTYSSPNTHLLGEAVALFFIGTLCPSLKSADRWQRLGWGIVQREARRQVRPDGWYFEQSSHYHVYALDFLLHARILAGCNGILVPPEFDSILIKMLEVLAALAQAGAVPAFGDDDGGRVFDPSRNQPAHLADPLTTGAVLFKNSQFKAAARGLREETLWLLGAEAAGKFEAVPQGEASLKSQQFPESGIYILAENQLCPQQMAIDAGPQGTGNSGHGHADALSAHLSVDGREWLVDPGTYCYMCPDGVRDAFRGTPAHNTLDVDGLSQAIPAGPFAWRQLPRVKTEGWAAGGSFDLFEGSHDGYLRLSQPVVHRRVVLHLKSSFWLVRDIAEGAGEHTLTVRWHLAPWLHVRYGDPGFEILPRATAAAGCGVRGLWCLPFKGHAWEQGIRAGDCSPVYGRKEPDQVLYFSTHAELPKEITVLFIPMTANSKPGQFERLETMENGPGLSAYRYNDKEAVCYFFFASRNEGWTLGPWASDARFLQVAANPSQKTLQVAWTRGSYFEFESKRWVGLKSSTNRFELQVDPRGSGVNCDNEEALPKGRIHIPSSLREAIWNTRDRWSG
ncbi:MAG TPA: alginate lyase family protein [Terriglobia bacterium]|nr:alginate lyase family protein [Terriglobia bacterium]